MYQKGMYFLVIELYFIYFNGYKMFIDRLIITNAPRIVLPEEQGLRHE
jgi:hypothetical protein